MSCCHKLPLVPVNAITIISSDFHHTKEGSDYYDPAASGWVSSDSSGWGKMRWLWSRLTVKPDIFLFVVPQYLKVDD